MNSIIDSMDMSFRKLQGMVKDRKVWSPWGPWGPQRVRHDLATTEQQQYT